MTLEEQNTYLRMENAILKTLKDSPPSVRRVHLHQVVEQGEIG